MAYLVRPPNGNAAAFAEFEHGVSLVQWTPPNHFVAKASRSPTD